MHNAAEHTYCIYVKVCTYYYYYYTLPYLYTYIQVINRSPKYKNKYVHRKTSLSLQHLSHEEIEQRHKLGLIRTSIADADYYKLKKEIEMEQLIEDETRKNGNFGHGSEKGHGMENGHTSRDENSNVFGNILRESKRVSGQKGGGNK